MGEEWRVGGRTEGGWREGRESIFVVDRGLRSLVSLLCALVEVRVRELGRR